MVGSVVTEIRDTLGASTITSVTSGRRTYSCMVVNSVGSVIRGTLGPSMMRRLTEYRPIMTKMEASRSMILRRTLSQPVSRPAAAPARVAPAVATQGLKPATIITAQTAPPRGKLPSTVRSGKRNRRNDRYTPRATREKIRPISTAPKKENKDMVVDQVGMERHCAGGQSPKKKGRPPWWHLPCRVPAARAGD